MSSTRSKQTRVVRQPSVLHDLHELQETQGKDSLDGHYARLMMELATLCGDRSNVITTESLQFFASSGLAEPVTLERAPERSDAQQKTSGTSKQDALLSADTARRQRVEELTRFFMEAKSDIEFALGGGRDFVEAQEKDKETEEEEREEAVDEEREDDKEDAVALDPDKEAVQLHAKLGRDNVDPVVYNVMLGHMREQDPALYGAILCHPLVTGVDPKKDKKKKKKRKDRERKEKQPAAQTNTGATMLTPDLTAEPLSDEDMKMNISRFVARSIAEGSLQGLMLAAKLVLSFLNQEKKAKDAQPPTFPLASHLRVLRGEKAPEYKVKKTSDAALATKEITTLTKADQSRSDTSTRESAEGNFESDLQSVVLEAAASAEMDLDSDSGSIAKLRARLSRFGDDREDGDEGKEENHNRGEGEDNLGGEGVDEDALMARAIALSLSPEVNLRDQVDTSLTSNSENKPDGAAVKSDSAVVKTRPAKFSAEELLELGPFALSGALIAEVDGVTVVMALIAQMTKVCLEYLKSCQQGELPNKSPVQPHPLTFMLLNSLLRDLHTSTAPPSQWAKNLDVVAKWHLFLSCSMLSLFRVLEVHFFHVEVMGIAPASVGLGQIPRLNFQQNDGGSENSNPLLESLKSLIVNYIALESPPPIEADEDVVGLIISSSPAACSTVNVQKAAAYYCAHIREQAMAAWIRAFAIFYTGQKERHIMLATKLAECHKLARSGERNVEWKFHQLDLLCARLALPDMAQHFVPTCVDIVEPDPNSEHGQKNQNGSDSSVKSIDDSALQIAASKTGKIKAKWSPVVVRASLDSGSLSARCIYDYISAHGPPGLLDAIKESPGGGLSDDALNADTLAIAYEEMWDFGRKQQTEALECISCLPSLIDLLRESILSTRWHNFSFNDSYELAHAPLIPLLENADDSSRRLNLNARTVLLRSFQDLMIQRLGGSRGDEPPALEFDSSRCAETMTLSDGNRTAKQYTAKQWGMVMATTGCPPNTGIHEWGVRLDRCEKGHIFLGVCTRDASVATYVGGDRQGWGLIGTRALWHARSKVRGDYGDGFTTGSVVRVRLNTDSGALSFGVGDSEWGIAFDGLTQHGTLYPAIGLYQRDDQVTILPVQPTVDSSVVASPRGKELEPKGVAIPAVLKPFLHHAGALLESCCTFLSSPALNDLSMASEQPEALRAGSEVERTREYERLVSSYPLLFSMVTPLISSLSLIQNYHGLTSTLAMTFIPWCTRTIQCVERVNRALRTLASSTQDEGVSPGNLVLSVVGDWELKSMAAGNIPAQQYHLTLSQDKDGSMHGRSSGPFTTVTLNGIARGTKVSFVETWRQGGTCLVEGRLRADGTVFTGSYEDTKSHTSGCIVGNKTSQNSKKKDIDDRQWVSNQLVIVEMVVANLLGYFGHALTNLENDDLLIDNATASVFILNDADTSDDRDNDDVYKLSSSECSIDDYDEWVNSILLEGGLPLHSVQAHLKGVLERCSEMTGFDSMAANSLPALTEATKIWIEFVLPKAISAPLPNVDSMPVGGARVGNAFLKDLIENRGEAAALDGWVSKHVGESPFVRLGGESMKATRRTVCAAMIWHSGSLSSIKRHIERSYNNFTESDIRPHDNLMHIWRAAQRVIEWAIRAKNSIGSSYAVVAGLVIRKAQFLLEIEPSAKALAAAEAVFALTTLDSGVQRIASKSAVYECAERIYSDVLVQVARFVEAPIRVSSLQSRMLGNCTAAFLRTIGMLSFRHFVGDSGSNHRGVLATERHQIIQSSFALSSALQWLSPTRPDCKVEGGLGSSLGKDFGDFSASVVPARTTSTHATTESSYYLSGLGGCGKHLKNDLRSSFESLYGYLSASLSTATWAHDADLQLVILLAWGIVIQPDDHSFLSRVGIFRVLQTVLDQARGSSGMSLTENSPGSSQDSAKDAVLIAENKKNIVQAALKVVHLLAAQVAHASDTADGLLSASDLPSTPGLNMGSIPLLRKPSGPETLGKSVFHMLYTELKNSLEDMRRNRVNMTSDAPPTVFVTDPTQSSDPSASGTGTSFREGLDDAQEYCYQICSLLYSVSNSPVCRSHLSSSRWLRLLLALVDVNSPQIQRRILKLLRRLLPSLDPSSIRVRYDELESFDMDSEDDYDADGQDELDHATTLINFFVGIVGINNPPSVAEAMLRRQADSNGESPSNQVLSSGFNAGGLAAEVVLLLRSLYESKKWTEYLNRAIADALASIPLACVTEQEGAIIETSDSDVEMEDMSKETPSLKSWTTQTSTYVKALSALCILDGHIEGLHVGGSVKIMPRSGSSLQEIAFRGARGVIVAYEPEKSAAEVLLRGSRASETSAQEPPLLPSRSIPTRPVRVPIDDLLAVPEVELPNNAFSDAVLQCLLVERFPYFLAEVKKSFLEMSVVDALNEADEDGGNDGDSEDDDNMSNDGSSSPSAMDSEMPSGTGVDESDSDVNVSPRHQKNNDESASHIEPTGIMAEMEKESRLHRMLLCQHGLRAAATLLKNDYCAATFIRGVGSTGLKDLLTVAISETPTTAGVGDISSLEESWLMLWSRWYAIRSAHAAPSPPTYTKEAISKTSSAEEADKLPGPMVQQMMEMGFPKEWCDVALARCSQNVEAAINFCFEHSSDMERLVAEYWSSRGSVEDGSSKMTRKDDSEAISPLLEQLSEMGFPSNWCKKALAANRNNVDAALTWILSNGEALEAEDRRDEDAKLRASGEDAGDGNVPNAIPEGEDTVLMPNPLRAVSGQACIGEHDLMVEGLVGGGFASVGAPDCIVSSGRWFYEAVLHTNGCIQIGWADVAFCGSADRGDGVGDGAHSWAYDGWRQQRWHGRSSSWGSKWKQGDVIGCGIDADAGTVIFSLNGKMRSANMGVAFRAIHFARGVYPCASFNRRERLQFNLGGSPFKYQPPPGFQPILNALSDTYDLSSVPKGFDVIGSREDCLEESMGEENYSNDTRYFARDMHPSMLRSSGHSRSSGFASSSGMTKVDALADIKALLDNRVYVELLVVTRSLAILQARRALLTLLAKWPTAEVGPFSVAAFLSSDVALRTATDYEDSSRFIDFIKLIASLSALHVSNVLPSASLTLPDGNALHLLDCGATGRFALGLLSGVVKSALDDALSTIASGVCDRNPLVDTILACISSEVNRASQRQYARIPWNSSEAAITATLIQITAEAGQTWSDKEVLVHPNLFLADWISGLLLESLEEYKEQLRSTTRDQIRQQLLLAWISSLKSPSMCVKERGATVLGGILQDILPKTSEVAQENEIRAIDDQAKTRLKMALDVFPLQRLVDLSQERLFREYPNMPVCSKYVQSIIELVSAAGLAMSAVGQSTDKLFESSSSQQLQACKQIESDLEPIHLKEFEEVMAAKQLVQAQQAAEEAVKQDKLAAERAAAAEAGVDGESASSLDDSNAIAGIGDAATQRGDEDTISRRNSGATNMEVDNSDSEEAPDITLSAIANMVTEDSDVMAATAAIAAVSGDRLASKGTGKRTKLPMPELLQEKADTTFEFRLPEKDPIFDTSLLNTQEIDLVEAAKRGIMGEEPRGWKHGNDVGVLDDAHTQLWSGTLTQFRLRQKQEESNEPELKVGCKVIRGPNWKWRDQDGGEGSVGIVEGVSPWSGVDGEGMSVRWPNDSLYTYRWGADGNFDLIHVEVDEAGNITHQHNTPKAKQEDEGSFGSELHLGVLLYLSVDEDAVSTADAEAVKVTGLMEWPDYGAAVRVVGLRYTDESLCIQELQLTRGNPDMGWTLRFGTEKWQPGTKYMLRPLKTGTASNEASHVDTLRGDYSHSGVKDGELVEIRGELQVSTKYLFTMDHYNHFSTIGISSDGLSMTCQSGESRNLALGTVGFSTGIHYWEVHVEQAEFGSVFIGVCEKAGPPGSQAALSSRLNRWHGWGFVNFRATYHNSTERIYGDHFNASDTIGVRLDMEQGKLSFFMDGIKFGEHIVSDLGVAFENMKGERNSCTLYPCIGMRKGGDRVTLNQKWVSMPGVSPRQTLSDAVDVSKALHSWHVAMQQEKAAATFRSSAGPFSPKAEAAPAQTPVDTRVKLPTNLLRESWLEWKRWSDKHWQRCHVRPRGISVDFDTSRAACIRVSNAAGLGAPLLTGDRVRMCSKCGQELNQPEEAVILGVYRGFLWYRTETQGNEGADEGRAWAWYWSPNELPELLLIRRGGKDMTLIENSAMDMSDDISAPELSPFKPYSALEERARTDFGAFMELATGAHSTESDMQLVERLNAYCAAIGLDVTNLSIMDVVIPEEMEEDENNTSATRGRSRTRSLVVDDYFTSPALKNITGPELRARTAVLKVLNSKILRVLPIIAIQPDDGNNTQPIEVATNIWSGGTSTKRLSLSMSLKLRSLRRLVFTSTKRAFWDDVLRATTTSTPLPSDEYEDPREIRVIRINRIQAQASKLSLLSQPGDRLRRSVFGQLYREMRAWSDSFFRRAYCGKGHGGQRRAFKVKFLGEGVNDYGGPYRAVFEQIVDELQMDNVELAQGEQGLLPLLIPCPNRRSATGSNQDKFLLNPSCGTALLANGPMALDLHRFLGKLIGTAVRHGLQMGLDLPSLVWRPLAGLEVNRAHLESVDVAVANNLSRVEELDFETEASAQDGEEVLGYLTLSTTLSDGVEVPLVPKGEKMPVTLVNRELYVQLVEKTRLTESSQQLAALKDGLASVLPMELAPLFTPRELEVLICGRREVDVDLLHQCTEYSEGADEAMPHVQHFWEVLREMTSEERTSFLRFVWARSRMPNSAKDFPMNFKLQAAHDPGAVGQPDQYLPHAQTCFFALRLPAYTSKEILRTKLLYAIQNSPNMDADVRLHNAEGWADA